MDVIFVAGIMPNRTATATVMRCRTGHYAMIGNVLRCVSGMAVEDEDLIAGPNDRRDRETNEVA